MAKTKAARSVGRPKKPVGESRPNKVTLALSDGQLEKVEQFRQLQQYPPNLASFAASVLVATAEAALEKGK